MYDGRCLLSLKISCRSKADKNEDRTDNYEKNFDY